MADNLTTSVQKEDEGITMVDLLKEEEELKKDAAAVLGGGDDSKCSYNLGYMKRQPLYACLTCCPATDKVSAGVCLACSLHCHENHDLIELYTKRNFRCDCGNSKFPNRKCELNPAKCDLNEKNDYNQNFKGMYCTCKRPYPDPDSSMDDEMIQCCICEDWLHSSHLENENVPEGSSYSEMMCPCCVDKIPFLSSYVGLTVSTVKKDNEVIDEIDVISDDSKVAATMDTNSSPLKKGECKLSMNKKEDLPRGALFFVDKWREALCSCDKCLDLYKSLKVEFLLDNEDTVSHYEAQGHKETEEAHQQMELDALSSLDRVTRTEMVCEYNNLSSSLRDYLKKFAENGKVVRDEDIKEFFFQLKANKRAKNDAGFQYSCK